MNDNINPITFDDLVQMGSRMIIPNRPNSDAPVGVGQLWLAKWDSFAEFVLIATADESNPVAVPLTFDDIHELEDSQVVRSSSLGDARAHWSRSRQMPAIALFSLVDPRVLGARSFNSQVPLADGDDPFWKELLPFDVNGSGQLPQRLRELDSSPARLGERLGISGTDALDLLRGRLMLSRSLLHSIADLLSVQPTAVLGMMPPIPEGLRVGLSKRKFRDHVRALGRRLGSSDSFAWRNSVYGTLAMPYRTAGQPAHDDWDARIERFFEVDQ